MTKLTIAIPTYDRNRQLRENLEILIPQLTAECSLLIIDNCSPQPVEPDARDLLDKLPANVEYRVIRNLVNVGGAANVLRCFEHCQTEWLWVLGDDDFVASEAIMVLLRAIREKPEAVFINFPNPNRRRNGKFRSTGIIDFVERMDDFGDILWISMGIYRVGPFLPHLRFGYFYSMTPHVAVLLSTLMAGGEVCFRQEHIVARPGVGEWSGLKYALGIMELLELPMEHSTRCLLATKILAAAPGIKQLVLQALFYAARSGDRDAALWVYDQMYFRYFYMDTRRATHWRYRLYRWLVAYPSTGKNLVIWYMRIRHGAETSSKLLANAQRASDLFVRL
jgi:glycosyltransferase involved in cell wall biosynthesis